MWSVLSAITLVLAQISIAVSMLQVGYKFGARDGEYAGYSEACFEVGGEPHVIDGVRVCTPPMPKSAEQL